MNKKINKKLENEMQIIACLESIKESANVARGYINHEYEINDVDELVVSLACVSEEIEEIKQLLFEITSDYEEELRELKYERL